MTTEPDDVNGTGDVTADLQSRARGLVSLAFDEAEDVIRHGSPAAKANMIRTVLGTALKELREEKEDDTLAAMREQFMEFMAATREQIGAGKTTTLVPPVPVPPSEPAPEDAPAAPVTRTYKTVGNDIVPVDE